MADFVAMVRPLLTPPAECSRILRSSRQVSIMANVFRVSVAYSPLIASDFNVNWPGQSRRELCSCICRNFVVFDK